MRIRVWVSITGRVTMLLASTAHSPLASRLTRQPLTNRTAHTLQPIESHRPRCTSAMNVKLQLQEILKHGPDDGIGSGYWATAARFFLPSAARRSCSSMSLREAAAAIQRVNSWDEAFRSLTELPKGSPAYRSIVSMSGHVPRNRTAQADLLTRHPQSPRQRSIYGPRLRYASSINGAREIVYAREVGRELRKFGFELVVHDEDGKLGSLRVALRLGQSLEGAFNVRLELAHGITGRQMYWQVPRLKGG